MLNLITAINEMWARAHKPQLKTTVHNGTERECMYSSTFSFTSVLDGDGWSMPHLGRSPPQKTHYPLYRRLDGPQGLSGWTKKIHQDLIPIPCSL